MSLPHSLPFKQWPETHQRVWTAAITPGDVFDDYGAAASWRPRTRQVNMEHFGRWLSFLAEQDRLHDGKAPWEQADRESVKAYLQRLGPDLSAWTIHSAILGLSTSLRALRPDWDQAWLKRIVSRLKSRRGAPKMDATRMLPIQEIYRTAIARLRDLEITGPTDKRSAMDHRNALMVALLAARPIRLSNLTNVRIGVHLRSSAEGWVLRFEPEEVKNRQELVFDFPADLERLLVHHMELFRPLLGDPQHDFLWSGKDGRPLSLKGVQLVILNTTQALTGKRINPHLFRDCAATSLAERSTTDLFAAAALLGHRDLATTERHYIRVDQRKSSRRVCGILDEIRRSGGRR